MSFLFFIHIWMKFNLNWETSARLIKVIRLQQGRSITLQIYSSWLQVSFSRWRLRLDSECDSKDNFHFKVVFNWLWIQCKYRLDSKVHQFNQTAQTGRYAWLAAFRDLTGEVNGTARVHNLQFALWIGRRLRRACIGGENRARFRHVNKIWSFR